MAGLYEHECVICGERRVEGEFWFLVARSELAEKIRVLAWHDEVATRHGVYCLCSTAHVREMVVNWMAGIEAIWFATREPGPTPFRQREYGVRVVREADTRGARELAELQIDRESTARALNDNPESVIILLDELSDALDREAAGTAVRLESGDEICSLHQL